MGGYKNRDHCELRYDYLVKILTRIPIHSVFRFKCVCKRWNAIISHPSFACIYASRASKASGFNSRFLLLFDVEISDVPRGFKDFSPPTADSTLRKFIRDELPSMVELEEPEQPFSTRALIHLPPASLKQYNVIAASGGLFLLCTNDLYHVCNFVTREIVAIPPPSDHMVSAYYIGLITQMEGPFVERFRIVQARKQKDDLLFRVYSSETETWTEQRFMIPLLGFLDAKIHFAFKGHLHWVDCEAGILAYDPFNKNKQQCRLLKFPNSRSVNSLDVCFNVSKEHIRFVEIPTLDSELAELWVCSVWKLEDYDNEEWCLEHRITHDWSTMGVSLSSNMVPILCDPVNPEIVYLWHVMTGQVFSFNLRTTDVCIDHNWKPYHHDLFIKMILPVEMPIWPSPIPRPSPRPSPRPFPFR